jgi:hypothetical protein
MRAVDERPSTSSCRQSTSSCAWSLTGSWPSGPQVDPLDDGAHSRSQLTLANQSAVAWRDRAHFLALASVATRHVLVDRAKAPNAQARLGPEPFTLDNELVASDHQPTVVLDINDALDRPALGEPRLARVVQCRFFAESSEADGGSAPSDLANRSARPGQGANAAAAGALRVTEGRAPDGSEAGPGRVRHPQLQELDCLAAAMPARKAVAALGLGERFGGTNVWGTDMAARGAVSAERPMPSDKRPNADPPAGNGETITGWRAEELQRLVADIAARLRKACARCGASNVRHRTLRHKEGVTLKRPRVNRYPKRRP